uniref:Uncharacterized protein n=1 Tax=Arundo donax TaxID=35708 RepID=A0A0A8YJ86_ARUDO
MCCPCLRSLRSVRRPRTGTRTPTDSSCSG